MIRVAVNGAGGRMGRTLVEAIRETEGLALTAAFEHPDSPALGTEVDGVPIGSDVAADADAFDILIDFTEPDATLAALPACEATAGDSSSAPRASTPRAWPASGPRRAMCPS